MQAEKIKLLITSRINHGNVALRKTEKAFNRKKNSCVSGKYSGYREMNMFVNCCFRKFSKNENWIKHNCTHHAPYIYKVSHL